MKSARTTIRAGNNCEMQSRAKHYMEAFDMSNLLLEALPENIAGDVPSLVDDIIAVLFKDNPARFLKAHHVAMDGAKQSLVTFEFDASMFDAEFRTALRARCFELLRRDDVLT